MVAAFLWYAQAQERWFIQDLKIGAMKATAAFAVAFVVATVVALLLAITIGVETKSMATV
ncbi:hypothetical protein D3C72_2407130 [compost metagenome]